MRHRPQRQIRNAMPTEKKRERMYVRSEYSPDTSDVWYCLVLYSAKIANAAVNVNARL